MTEHLPSVLDASALLALLHVEPGAAVVERAVDGAAISTVNWSEVCQRSVARGIDTGGLRADVEGLGVEIEPFTAGDAEHAADMWPVTRQLGLSLGDRACLALASRLGRPALTADRSWIGLELDVEIQPIR
jgi:ribonuclease VapC